MTSTIGICLATLNGTRYLDDRLQSIVAHLQPATAPAVANPVGKSIAGAACGGTVWTQHDWNTSPFPRAFPCGSWRAPRGLRGLRSHRAWGAVAIEISERGWLRPRQTGAMNPDQDPFYLTWKARGLEHTTRFGELAGEINVNMPRHVVNRHREVLDCDAVKTLSRAKLLVISDNHALQTFRKPFPDPLVLDVRSGRMRHL